MIIGLLVGLICGGVRDASMNFNKELGSYGGRRISQRQFEKGLVSKFQGRAQFTDVVVYPYRLGGSSSGAVKLHVVSGLYFDGKTELENGRLAARWQPAYFVASVPYRATEAQPGAPVRAAGTAREGQEFGSVLAYLESLKGSQGVQFQYARWWWVSRPLFLWTCGGVVFIGIVWPTIVNLLAYGSFFRPAEAKGESLWKEKSAAAVPAPKPAVTEADAQALRELERELEANLATAPAQPTAEVPPPRAAVRELASTPLQPVAAAAPGKKKDFGADQGDFYPTERHAKHGE
jgi:hypothetical protein